MFTFIRRTAVAATVLGSCGVASAQTRLQGAGATFPNPIYQKWVSEYEKVNPAVQIDYQSIGSGGGIKGITGKTVDFAGSDAPMSKKEIAAAKEPVVHIPTVAGSVVAAYNLPGFSGELKLSGEVLAEIFMGKITTWNDPKIAALNQGVQLPGLAITPVWRTDGSGTTFVFTNYLATQSDEYKESVGAGKSVEWPTGQGGKGNEGVTAGVQTTEGAARLRRAELRDPEQAAVRADAEQGRQVRQGLARERRRRRAGAVEQMNESLAVDIWNQPGDNAPTRLRRSRTSSCTRTWRT